MVYGVCTYVSACYGVGVSTVCAYLYPRSIHACKYVCRFRHKYDVCKFISMIDLSIYISASGCVVISAMCVR